MWKKVKKKCDCFFQVFDISISEEKTCITHLLLRCKLCGNFTEFLLGGKWNKRKLIKLEGKPCQFVFALKGLKRIEDTESNVQDYQIIQGEPAPSGSR